MVERRGLLDRRDLVRRPLGDALVQRGLEARLVVLGGEVGLPVQRLADGGELGGGSSAVPKCVSASACGSQAAIVSSERSHASTSMSGGGVGASVRS